MRHHAIFAITLVLACSPGASLGATDWEWNDVERIVAIGDIHGSYDNLVAVLQNAELIDNKQRWIGGKTHLVQNGDIVDRGPESRKAMDLMMKLEDRAEDAGGRVHVLIGNHEAMNIVGILDLVSDEEYSAFVDRNSRKTRNETFERYFDQLRRDARASGEQAPKKSEAKRQFEEDYPLGYIEHRRAFAPDGRYGRWIMEHNTAIKINGIIFSHGDWSEKFSEIGLEKVNDQVRKELKGEIPIQDGMTFDEVSPLQYRGWANTKLTKAAQDAKEPEISRTLENLDASRMVVGHTLTPGMIESRFGGKHISIDVGMLELYRGGHRVALEIVGDEMWAIHDGGKVPIPARLDETTLDAYVAAVADVDPTNVDVQLLLVDNLREAGDTEDAASRLEALLKRPEHVPFRYRDFLGNHYEAKGDVQKAQEQYRLYIESLSVLVERSPDNVNLANLLARFCLDKNLELDVAEAAMRRAVEKSPANPNLRLTLARVFIAKESFEQAMEALSEVPPAAESAYDLHYLTGLAYLGMRDTENAKKAFQSAVDAAPARDEAKQELEKLEGISGGPQARSDSEGKGEEYRPAVAMHRRA